MDPGKLEEIVKDFECIDDYESRQPQILEVFIDREKYRLETHRTENANAPWRVKVYSNINGEWLRVEDFPWTDDRDEESALRMALSFLQDQHA